MSLVKKITIIATSILLIVALVVGIYFLAKNWKTGTIYNQVSQMAPPYIRKKI